MPTETKFEISVINNDSPISNPIQYEIKVPYTQTDGYGTEYQMFRPEIVTEEGLTADAVNLQAQLDVVNSKLKQIQSLK